MNKFIYLSITLLFILAACHKSSPAITPAPSDQINSHWTVANTNTTTTQIISVQFISADTGFFFGYGDFPVIYKSTDGGLNWHLVKSFNSPQYSGFYTINSNKMVIAGSNTNVYSSSDGGNNFNIVPNQTNKSNILQFQLLNNNTWLIFGLNNISQSIDLQNWSVVHSLIDQGSYRIICFPDQNTGYVAGGTEIETNAQSYNSSYGVLSKTTDGGKTWQDLNTGSFLNNSQNFHEIVGMSFIDATNGWLATDYKELLHTSDGGKTWATINTSLVGTSSGILFQTMQNGYYIIGGYIYSTINGGTSFTKDYFTSANLYCIYQGKNGKVYITGENGLILIGGI